MTGFGVIGCQKPNITLSCANVKVSHHLPLADGAIGLWLFVAGFTTYRNVACFHLDLLFLFFSLFDRHTMSQTKGPIMAKNKNTNPPSSSIFSFFVVMANSTMKPEMPAPAHAKMISQNHQHILLDAFQGFFNF